MHPVGLKADHGAVYVGARKVQDFEASQRNGPLLHNDLFADQIVKAGDGDIGGHNRARVGDNDGILGVLRVVVGVAAAAADEGVVEVEAPVLAADVGLPLLDILAERLAAAVIAEGRLVLREAVDGFDEAEPALVAAQEHALVLTAGLVAAADPWNELGYAGLDRAGQVGRHIEVADAGAAAVAAAVAAAGEAAVDRAGDAGPRRAAGAVVAEVARIAGLLLVLAGLVAGEDGGGASRGAEIGAGDAALGARSRIGGGVGGAGVARGLGGVGCARPRSSAGAGIGEAARCGIFATADKKRANQQCCGGKERERCAREP